MSADKDEERISDILFMILGKIVLYCTVFAGAVTIIERLFP